NGEMQMNPSTHRRNSRLFACLFCVFSVCAANSVLGQACVQTKITPDDPSVTYFGIVAIDGDTCVVGADDYQWGIGEAHVYIQSGRRWIHQAKLVPSDGVGADHFGQSVAIEGDTILVGSTNPHQFGSVYVFVRSGTTWTQQAKLTSNEPS